MQEYLIAVLDTDDAANPRFLSGSVIQYDSVKQKLYALLDSHAPFANAQMQQEADSVRAQVGRWKGEATRFCGYLTRYDVYPVDAGTYADARTWRARAGRYETAGRYQQARAAMAGVGLTEDEADYKAAEAWLAGRDPYWIGFRAQDLAAFRALAGREDVAPHLTAYRPWQWALATAKTGAPIDQVERELLAEIAERAAR